MTHSIDIVDASSEFIRPLAALLGGYGIEVRHYSRVDALPTPSESASATSTCLVVAYELLSNVSPDPLRSVRGRPQSPAIIVIGDRMSSELRQALVAAGAAGVIERRLLAAYLLNRIAALFPAAKSDPAVQSSLEKLADGTEVTFRMMAPEDADIEQAFVQGLSARSRYLRFFSGLQKLPPSVLHDFTHPDYPISYAVIATIPDGDAQRQIGVARYAPTGTPAVAEFAVVVADDWQRRGVASQLMRLLIVAASVGGIHRLEGLILRENLPMLNLATKLGFTYCPSHNSGGADLLYAKDLRPQGSGR